MSVKFFFCFLLSVFLVITGFCGEKIKIDDRDAPDQKNTNKVKRRGLNRDRELIRKMLGGDRYFQEIEKEFEELMNQFHKGSFDSFFKDDNFDKFFKKWQPQRRLNSNEFRWIETPTEKILIFKGKPAKNSPLSIKVENGIITISGTVVSENEVKLPTGGISKSFSSSSFSKSFSVPPDTDSTKAVIDNNINGEIVIKLPKLTKSIPKVPSKKNSNDQDRIPISPGGSGTTI
jgi:HSP20 family molecular chaperone IbpA